MLKYRIITALILIPFILGLIIFASTPIFMISTGLIILFATWEWTTIIGWQNTKLRLLTVLGMSFLLFCSSWLPIVHVLIFATAWWLFNGVCLMFFARDKLTDFFKQPAWLILAGLFTLISCWVAINQVHMMAFGRLWLLLMLFLIWAADSGAYFIGRFYGKHHMAPNISPKKTWEGFWAGLVSTLLTAVAAALLLHLSHAVWSQLFLLTLITFSFAIIGDLYISMLKRIRGIKDTGNLLPGHGGLLDRIDSLLAVMPAFSLGLLFMGWIR